MNMTMIMLMVMNTMAGRNDHFSEGASDMFLKCYQHHELRPKAGLSVAMQESDCAGEENRPKKKLLLLPLQCELEISFGPNSEMIII